MSRSKIIGFYLLALGVFSSTILHAQYKVSQGVSYWNNHSYHLIVKDTDGGLHQGLFLLQNDEGIWLLKNERYLVGAQSFEVVHLSPEQILTVSTKDTQHWSVVMSKFTAGFFGATFLSGVATGAKPMANFFVSMIPGIFGGLPAGMFYLGISPRWQAIDLQVANTADGWVRLQRALRRNSLLLSPEDIPKVDSLSGLALQNGDALAQLQAYVPVLNQIHRERPWEVGVYQAVRMGPGYRQITRRWTTGPDTFLKRNISHQPLEGIQVKRQAYGPLWLQVSYERGNTVGTYRQSSAASGNTRTVMEWIHKSNFRNTYASIEGRWFPFGNNPVQVYTTGSVAVGMEWLHAETYVEESISTSGRDELIGIEYLEDHRKFFFGLRPALALHAHTIRWDFSVGLTGTLLPTFTYQATTAPMLNDPISYSSQTYDLDYWQVNIGFGLRF